MKRTYTAAQKAAFDERRAAVRALARDISKMTDGERSALAARLPGIATIEGRNLSVFNSCLLAAQCPQATVVGGFRQWKNAGRAVRKGEHGHAIWIPTKTRADQAAEKDAGELQFMLGTVFDVSQTEEITV